jgi:HEAT repeat protein
MDIKKIFLTITFIIIPIIALGQANKTEDDWITILANGNVVERREASEMLGEVGGEASVMPLINALNDEDYIVVKNSMDSLVKIGDERGIEPIANKLESEEKWVRKKAEESLIGFGDKVVPYMQFLLEADKPWVRESSIRILTGVGDSTMIDIVRFYIRDPDIAVIVSAIDYAVQANDYNAVPVMIEQIGKRSIMLNEKIKSALISMGKDVIPYIVPILENYDPLVREAGVVVLGEIGEEGEIKLLIEMMNDPDIYVRNRLVMVLKERVNEYEDLIIDKFSSSEPVIREEVCRILAGSLSDKSSGILVKGLDDKISKVREASARSIGERGIVSATGSLLTLLDDRDSGVRCTSVWALGIIGDENVISDLYEHYFIEDDGKVRAEICLALSKLGYDDEVREVLVAGLEDKDYRVRFASAQAIGELGSPVFVDALRDARFDDNQKVREAVFDALKAIGTPEALDALYH